MHSRGLLVVDIKPHNFAMGLGDSAHVVHLFDFGHSKLYLDPVTGKHVPYLADRSATGTVAYASIAAHRHYGAHPVTRHRLPPANDILLKSSVAETT